MKKNTVLIILFVLLIGGGLFWAARSHKSGNANNGKLENTSIRLQYLHGVEFAGYYYADKAGFYKDNGINMTLNVGGTDMRSTRLVASHSDKFGIASSVDILEARETGLPFVALAAIHQKNGAVLLTLADSGIKTLPQVVGKKVAINPDGETDILFKAALKKQGIDPASVEEVPVKQRLQALLSKQVDVDASRAYDHPLGAIAQGYKVNLIWLSDYGVNPYDEVLFTTDDMVRDHPDLVRGVVQATVKGWKEALANPDQAVSYTLMYDNQLKKNELKGGMKAIKEVVTPDHKPIGYMDKQGWESAQNLLLGAGALKKPVDINKIFTTQFLPKT